MRAHAGSHSPVVKGQHPVNIRGANIIWSWAHLLHNLDIQITVEQAANLPDVSL